MPIFVEGQLVSLTRDVYPFRRGDVVRITVIWRSLLYHGGSRTYTIEDCGKIARVKESDLKRYDPGLVALDNRE